MTLPGSPYTQYRPRPAAYACRWRLLALIILFALVCLKGFTVSAQQARCCDMQAAIDYCTTTPLQGLEGIWIYPEDNVTVLIAKNNPNDGNVNAPAFDIIVVDTPDCMLQPGELLGSLSQLADEKNYRLTLFTGRRGTQLISPAECLATLNTDKSALIIKKTKLRISLNPLSILPKFWRTLRLRVDNPLNNAPKGMIRIFPNDDGTPLHYGTPLYF